MRMSNVLTIGEGAVCQYPRQTYRPADATPEQHLGLREGLYRSARHDGLDEEAADEAASAMYMHWLARDYSALDYARGDHLRAYYAIRAYARRSQWRGFTEQRRASRRVQTVELLAWRERRRAGMVPQPGQAVEEADRLAEQHWTKTARAARDGAAAAGMSVAAYIAAAYGVDADRPAYAGHPAAPLPQPWAAADHAAIVNRKPAADWEEVEHGHRIRLRG